MTRHRARTPIVLYDDAYVTKRVINESLAPPSDDIETVLTNSQFTTKYETEEMDDTVTPGYHLESQKGVIVNNDLLHVKYKQWDIPYVVDIQERWQTRTGIPGAYIWTKQGRVYAGRQANCFGIGTIPACFADYPVPPRESLCEIALAKAWSNCTLNEAQALVMIGEAQKTIFSLISIFSRLIKILKKIKRLDVKGIASELSAKELADRYMELRYAIRPMIYDFNGIVTALKFEASETKDRMTFRGNEYWTDEVVEIEDIWNGDWPGPVNTVNRYKRLTRRSKTTFDVRSGVLTELDTVNDLHVWGFAEPIEAAWELIPFSFIVDWFFNVGDTIAAWTPNFGLRALSSWTVSTETIFRTAERTGLPADMPTDSATWQAICHTHRMFGGQIGDLTITKTRTANPSRAITPNFDLRLNCLKLADLLIIAKGIFFSR